MKIYTYILYLQIPLIMWHRKAMDKGIVEAMATKFSEKFAISMLKKHRSPERVTNMTYGQHTYS